MLVTMTPILEAAKKGGYCVPAPNYKDFIQLKKAIEAAEEMEAPLILDIFRKFASATEKGFSDLAYLSVKMAKEAKVPVAINLDHGADYEHIVQAMKYGCTSVMVDRSWMDFEDNIRETSEICKIAHAFGVSVEAEIGHVGTNNTSTANASGIVKDETGIERTAVKTVEDKKKFYTDVNQAIEFVKRTGVDALAVAVGTVHGLYPEGFKPSLDFDLLQELHEKIDVPLVLHGGSGTGEENLIRAAKCGACKLNVGSDLFKAARISLAEAYKNGATASDDFSSAYYEGYKNELKHYMDFLGAKGKAY